MGRKAIEEIRKGGKEEAMRGILKMNLFLNGFRSCLVPPRDQPRVSLQGTQTVGSSVTRALP